MKAAKLAAGRQHLAAKQHQRLAKNEAKRKRERKYEIEGRQCGKMKLKLAKSKIVGGEG
jgi:hypothetical protein